MIPPKTAEVKGANCSNRFQIFFLALPSRLLLYFLSCVLPAIPTMDLGGLTGNLVVIVYDCA